MGSVENGRLELRRLVEGLPGITQSRGTCMAEAAAVCFENQKHPNGVLLAVSGTVNAKKINIRYEVYWPPVTDQMLRCWHGLQDATEEGAYGIACLLVDDLTDYTVIQKSKKGSGVDFWLGWKDSFLFQDRAARLEISGILKGDSRAVADRLHTKIEQTRRSDSTTLPVYIVIVEFSSPLSRVVERVVENE